MKDHFFNLFNYNHYANQKIAETILTLNGPEKAIQLMAHALTAEQVWLRRCQGEYKVDAVLWPDWKAEDFGAVINETHQGWLDYLNGTTENDLEKTITYQNFAGNEFTMHIIDILTHVINHGTHTRAQAGVYTKLAGEIEKLPVTDYSFYINSIK